MFWKILLGFAIFAAILSVIFIIIALRAFYATTDTNTEDIAFGGFLLSIVVLLFSLLIAVISTIFVLRNSKKAFDAKNVK